MKKAFFIVNKYQILRVRITEQRLKNTSHAYIMFEFNFIDIR